VDPDENSLLSRKKWFGPLFHKNPEKTIEIQIPPKPVKREVIPAKVPTRSIYKAYKNAPLKC